MSHCDLRECGGPVASLPGLDDNRPFCSETCRERHRPDCDSDTCPTSHKKAMNT